MDSDSISLTTESQYIAACLKPSIANTCVFFCLSSRFPFSNSKLETRAAFWNESANTMHPTRFLSWCGFGGRNQNHTQKRSARLFCVCLLFLLLPSITNSAVSLFVCVFAFSTRDNDWIESNWTDTHNRSFQRLPKNVVLCRFCIQFNDRDGTINNNNTFHSSTSLWLVDRSIH